MRLIALEVENFMRVKHAVLEFDGSTLRIYGENEEGKSSFLYGIPWLLLGREFPHKRVVREGTDRARVIGRFSEMIVEKVQPADGKPHLEVRSADGKAKYPSPQAMLSDLMTSLASDPQSIADLDADELARVMRELIGLDWTELDRQYAATYEARTDANREVKRLEGALASLTSPPADSPDEEVSVSALLEEQRRRIGLQQERDRRSRAVDAAATELDSRAAAALALRQELLAADRALEAAQLAQAEAIAALQALPDPDVAAVTAQIANAGEVNRIVQVKRERAATAGALEVARGSAAELSRRLQGIDDEKQLQLSYAKFPLPDLTFTLDGKLLYRGVPFSQASDSAKLLTGIALLLALDAEKVARGEPSLPLILIRQANLLGRARLKEACDMVAAHPDGQLILEFVGAPPKDTGGFVIVDGELSFVDPEPVPAEGAAP